VKAPARVRDAVAPAWLIEAVRPRPAPVPTGLMIRAALAITVPLAAGFAGHDVALGLLPAIGGLLASVVDIGGPYPARVRRVVSATVAGGATGLVLGTLVHGRGWLTFAVLIAVAGVSVLLSAAGSTASVTGLQLLVYTAFGTGPLGGLQPWWHTPLLLLTGVAWALLLIVPGWLLFPHVAEQRSVAAVYQALADELRAAGTEGFTGGRLAVTNAMNEAYDQLLAIRSASSGQDRRLNRLVALLTQSHLIAEAVAALAAEGGRPPVAVIRAAEGLADAVRTGAPPPAIPAPWRPGPGPDALYEAMAGAVRLLRAERVPRAGLARPSHRERIGQMADELRGGRLIWLAAVRLMVCTGVAALLSEVLPLQRSYWVILTVAIVLKPDLGSVFARAVQRGLGTVVGVVLGAVILAVVPYGWLLLIPVAVLAALLPYGRSRNYGLMSTFLTPLIVLLLDLPGHTGWRLAGTRLIDTLLGCAIVLLIGYAPWPSSWYAHLPAQFARTVGEVCDYLEQALVVRSPDRRRLRRRAYRALADLRAEFQRTLSEPPAASRDATVWWPAVAALEEVVDAVTAAAVAADHGVPPPPPQRVRELIATLEGIAAAEGSGSTPPRPAGPAGGDNPVADAVHRVQAALT
jgi:uncharacterized membrane protein YccC